MKKILLLACACLVASTSAVAQIIDSEVTTTQTFYVEQPKVSPYPYYQGEVNLGYQTPAASILETIHGARFNKYLFVGAGLGLHYVGEKELVKGADYLDISEDFRVTFFANAKAYYPIDEVIAPFLNLSMGYGVGIYGGGFYCDFGAGLKYNRVTMGLGLQHHGINDYPDGGPNYNDKINFKYNSFYLKLGFCW